MEIGDKIIAINNKPLPGNDVAPHLVLNEEYILLNKIKDSKDNEHYDVGLKSNYNFIRSFETKENLPNGDKIHWCHPSRFKLKK